MFTFICLVIYRIGAEVTAPGVDVAGHARLLPEPGGQAARPLRPVRGRPAVARDGVRAGHHAVHLGDHLRADRGRGDPDRREDAEGRGRPEKADAVHALCDGRPRDRRRRGASRSSRSRCREQWLIPGFWFKVQMSLFLTAGAIFVMWLGEQITERGLGNGASLMIFFSIVDRFWPSMLNTFRFVSTGAIGAFSLLIFAIVMLAVVAAVVAITLAARRVLIQIPQRTYGAGPHARGGPQLHSAAHQLVRRHADRVRAVGDRRAGRGGAVQPEPDGAATWPSCSCRARGCTCR